ncbi:MAG: cob(I)yrinic acid a,c-diamide adenosyltransferase [Draconibacterium sp.]|nr:cob(I)yrinic acid a,c-diamide adenosyltransferase [Draconibacterium sp.]
MGAEFKVYTKTGDDGTTGLVGGNRVKKYDLRLEAYGTVDELNASIGVLRSFDMPDSILKLLIQIQNKLFNIGSRLASDKKGDSYTAELKITEENIIILENAIDEFEKHLPELKGFILPGGELSVAQCHVARTVCRRAERRIVEFSESYPVQTEIIKYVNRLSDFLFVLARKLASDRNIEETNWAKD